MRCHWPEKRNTHETNRTRRDSIRGNVGPDARNESCPVSAPIANTTLDITWKLSTDGGATWFPVGESKNHLYVNGSWNANDEFETVIDLGCKGADGLRPHEQGELEPGASGADQQVADGIFGKFHLRDVRRVDNTQMTYWGPIASQDYTDKARNDGNYTAAGLLKYADGRCEAWAGFFVDVLGAQGVTATRVNAAPGITSVYSQSQNITYKIIPPGGPTESTSGMLIQAGLPGQNNAHPRNLFEGHALVALGNTIYDPSYGTAFTAASLQDAEAQWTEASVAGFVYQNPNDPSDLLTTSLHQLAIIDEVVFI